MTTKTVDPAGAGGGFDYSSWSTWFAACPADLRAGTGTNDVWRGEGSGTFTSASALLTISGTLTDATHNIIMTTRAGQAARDNANAQTNRAAFVAANGCSIECTGSYAMPVTVGVEFTVISNLQITSSAAFGSSPTLLSTLATGTSQFTVDNCIIENSRGLPLQFFGSNSKVRNSLCVQRRSGAAAIVSIGGGGSAYNCTFAVPASLTAATVGNLGSYAAPTFENCVFLGCTSLWSTGSTPTFTTSMTSVAGNPNGTTSVTYNTSLVKNVTDGTHDFKAVTGSALLNAGTTDATNAANDIVGTARPQGASYDVGCWELVVAAAGGYVPYNFPSISQPMVAQ
jgi:hypothetical protein